MVDNIAILIADDEPIIRSLFTDLLKEEGYDVEAVANGQEAIETARYKHFDFAFLDVHMPVLNGLEALLQLIDMQPDIKIVMMDSYPDELLADSEKSGAVTCIHKPFNLKEVLDFIKNNSN